jgi:hypothetical protein
MIITPEIWGPYGWKFIHMVTLGYPQNPTEEDKLNYFTFFTSIKNILPCSLCSNHYKLNLDKYPLDDNVLSSREALINWAIDMHNEVNISNNKKVLDYSTARDLILNNYQEPKIEEKIIEPDNTQDMTSLYILFILFISLIIIALWYKKS